MATFSDLVTLLLTFFVLLMSMANFDDPSKVDAVLTSIRKALGSDGFDAQMLKMAKEEAFTQDTERTESIKPTVAKLREAFSKHISDSYVTMSETPTEVRIRLDERVFFRSGSRELHPAAYALIGDIGRVLAIEPVDIRVEGYADGMGSEFENRDLSSDRALAVLMALRDRGVAGEQLQHVGFGSFHPGSTIGEDTAWNRRVEIVLKTDDASGAAAVRQLDNQGDSDAGR
ncbi:MAG: OmpA family protein [Rhodobacterales bacterium]|nr:OmpA family protein [Rhodobacterales bacterium]